MQSQADTRIDLNSPTGSRPSTIAAIVLAYSRFETLKQLIAALRGQTRPADEIIVVYQGSRDDIAEWLSSQASLTYVRQDNKGSAGGFCRGIEEAYQRGHGWAWIFDDDAIPEAAALQRLIEVPHFKNDATVFMASRVVDEHGTTYMSPLPADANRWYATVLTDKCVEVVGACWLGLLVSLPAVRKCGLPLAEFFFLEEDLEFTARLARSGPAYCAIESVIVHYQGNAPYDPFGKDFLRYVYLARNSVARTMLEPGSWPVRTIRAVRQASQFISAIVRRKAPLRALPWVIHGFFLRARIRYPN
jgi:GT2 family glycosyltransferase